MICFVKLLLLFLLTYGISADQKDNNAAHKITCRPMPRTVNHITLSTLKMRNVLRY